jgi:hypothetical protein
MTVHANRQPEAGTVRVAEFRLFECKIFLNDFQKS